MPLRGRRSYGAISIMLFIFVFRLYIHRYILFVQRWLCIYFNRKAKAKHSTYINSLNLTCFRKLKAKIPKAVHCGSGSSTYPWKSSRTGEQPWAIKNTSEKKINISLLIDLVSWVSDRQYPAAPQRPLIKSTVSLGSRL